ncbi:V-type proton ATPase catalytic subunit A [Tanacetum coccineum]|uniref:V-type proton ATPase catalytic subunit A n=1 Tax=Tanacetum coccineum TaxID=301880 RepID=A0ABQ5A7F9_9ASTR
MQHMFLLLHKIKNNTYGSKLLRLSPYASSLPLTLSLPLYMACDDSEVCVTKMIGSKLGSVRSSNGSNSNNNNNNDTKGLITVPHDHQLNGEVEVLIVVTTNTMADTQKESTPHMKKEAFDTFSSVAATEHVGSRHVRTKSDILTHKKPTASAFLSVGSVKMGNKLTCTLQLIPKITWKRHDRALLTSSTNLPRFLTGVCKVVPSILELPLIMSRALCRVMPSIRGVCKVGYANDGKIALLEHAIFHNFLWRTPSPKVAIPESEFEKMPRMTLISISCRRFKKRIEGGKSNLYDKYCLFYKSVWMMRNIIHFYNLANQFEDLAEGKDVLTGKFKKLHEDLPAGFRNLEGETQ